MIPEEQVLDYFKRSGDTYLVGDYYIANEHGFMTFWFHDKEPVLMLGNVYGDGKYWEQEAIRIAKEHNMKKIRFGTTRNPKVFIKRFRDFKITGYILEREV